MGKAAKPYRVGRARTGLGLFATAPIGKRALVIEYKGRRIPTKLAQEIEKRRANKYLFEINGRWTIDGSSRRNLARYVNHACDPNTEAELIRGRMMFRAVKAIVPGDEITIDYGEDYIDLYFGKTGCLCATCKPRARKPRAQATK
ncbi:SET domain-containing protein [Pseudolabrys taiwanensis]|uniref:SET domain-containing protein n=1 Tax=Pseudolabrys taiwanensis TaxID=331696 RepID=A0A345ZQL2_9HYPH|nr:SET domain-containing protein [Pseudolabrys taiwanensis]AXK79209.1 SET domain-containing protein [Pseudolabrys taiwanensis]